MSMLGNTLPSGLRLAVIGSMLAHVAVLLGFVFATAQGSARPTKRQTVLTTKLVRLGKERPKDWLPRKVAPAPAPAPQPVVVPVPPVAPPPPKVPAPPKAAAKKPPPRPAQVIAPPPSARERVAQLGQVRGALDRLRKNRDKDEPVEGHPDGVSNGEVTDLTRAIIGNKFATEVYHCLKARYAVEGVDADKLSGRRVTVVVRVASDGEFLDSKIEQGSGLAVMDRAVERAIKRCGKVSPPDEAIRDQVRVDGIEIVFEP